MRHKELREELVERLYIKLRDRWWVEDNPDWIEPSTSVIQKIQSDDRRLTYEERDMLFEVVEDYEDVIDNLARYEDQVEAEKWRRHIRGFRGLYNL